jgi:hypothetical protein
MDGDYSQFKTIHKKLLNTVIKKEYKKDDYNLIIDDKYEVEEIGKYS